MDSRIPAEDFKHKILLCQIFQSHQCMYVTIVEKMGQPLECNILQDRFEDLCYFTCGLLHLVHMGC